MTRRRRGLRGTGISRAFAAGLAVASVLVGTVTGAGAHGGGPLLWGFDESARIVTYDIEAHTEGPSCLSSPTADEAAIAFDPADANLWYSPNDGRIYKVTVPPDCAPVTSIPFGDGPGGSVQDDIGALDVDPDDGMLWSAGSARLDGRFFLYKVDTSTGAILQSCSVAGNGGVVVNDTLAVARLPGLGGSGTYLLTDASRTVFEENNLYVIDVATCRDGAPAPFVTTLFISTEEGATGIDFEADSLINVEIGDGGAGIFDHGPPPFGPILDSMASTPMSDITLQTGPVVTATCRGMSVSVAGTSGDDVLRGTEGRDVIAGLAGDDVIDGLGGDDVVCAGEGHDRVMSDDGNDRIFGGPGNDTLNGGSGRDVVSGEGGDDLLIGGAGADTLRGGSGRDQLSGRAGDDVLDGGPDADTCDGGTGSGDSAVACEVVSATP